jgi:hypothetical protein
VSGGYEFPLDLVPGAKVAVDFKTVKGEVVAYAIVLVLETPFGEETIRVYDAAHGFNEMHRYTRTGGKQDGVVFSDGTLAEGMQEAIEAVKLGPLAMIEGWKGN